MQTPPTPRQLKAPAKINLYLEVLGRRADGYHDLRMMMAPIDWFDDIEIEYLPEDPAVRVRNGGGCSTPEGTDNLCVRAARYYLQRTAIPGGARIVLTKRIPAGAGLGGGSSDAATTILGLEDLTGVPLGASGRAGAAFDVGADVPFFFAGGPAWVEGIGEQVTPLGPVEPLWLVLINPGVFLSTARVFSVLNIQLTSPRHPPTIPQFSFPGVVAALRNDLQHAAVSLEPVIGEALGALATAGAAGTLMSGSGSTVFGVFAGKDQARQAAMAVRRETGDRGWQVRVAHTIAPAPSPESQHRNSHWGVDKR